MLHFRAKPGAKANAFGFDEQGVLWLRIAAPAVEGKANEACVKYLGELLNLRKSQIHLKSGLASRYKSVELDISEEQKKALLEGLRSRN